MFFDQDGVLIDSEGAWDEARREIVAENGGHWKPEATRAMMGMSAPEWSRYVRDELGVPLEPEEISDRVVQRLLAGYERELPLMLGAVDAVKRIAARRLGVDPTRSAAVEDSSNGLRAAAAAGMLVVAFPNREFPPDPDALALAAVVLDSGSLDELSPELLGGCNVAG